MWILLLLLLVLDLISKWYIRKYNPQGINYGSLYVIPTRNYGFILNLGSKFRNTFIIKAHTLVIILFTYFIFTGFTMNTFTTLALAGAYGNLIDRITNGYVTDFLAFKFKNIKAKKVIVFNLADIYIFIFGIYLLVLSIGG